MLLWSTRSFGSTTPSPPTSGLMRHTLYLPSAVFFATIRRHAGMISSWISTRGLAPAAALGSPPLQRAKTTHRLNFRPYGPMMVGFGFTSLQQLYCPGEITAGMKLKAFFQVILCALEAELDFWFCAWIPIFSHICSYTPISSWSSLLVVVTQKYYRINFSTPLHHAVVKIFDTLEVPLVHS